jgi:hypothetical protein
VVFRRRGRRRGNGEPDGPGRGKHESDLPSNTALVQAMRDVATYDAPETRARLYQLFLDTRLIVATFDVPTETGPRTVQAGEPLKLITLADEQGPGRVLPAFTSVETLLAWRPDGGGYLALPGLSLFELAAANQNDTVKIVIDPGSPTHGTIVRAELEALAKARLPLENHEVLTQEAEVRIGLPAVRPPDDAIEAVRAAMAEEPRALRAFLFLLQQGDAAPEMCIGVEFRGDVAYHDERLAMRAIVDGSGSRSAAARSFGFMRADDGLLKSLADGAGAEIYRR